MLLSRLSSLVREKPDAVLGLATGATPLGVYALLVRRFERGKVDFARITIGIGTILEARQILLPPGRIG